MSSLRRVLVQPTAIFLYLCAPRVALALLVGSSELKLTRNFFDQTLAYTGVLLGLYFLVGLLSPRRAAQFLIAWLHVEFVLRAVEAGLIYSVGIGYSPLFFYHLETESLWIALTRQWPAIVLLLVALILADRLLRRLFAATPFRATTRFGRFAVAMIAIMALQSAYVLGSQRARLAQNFTLAELVANWHAYASNREVARSVALNSAERNYVDVLGIGMGTPKNGSRGPARPSQPLNLITIYLEGFQANFTESGGSPFPGLTPNLDRFASKFVTFTDYYNAVTPTINAIISSQCGILSEVENEQLHVDRGYTRNLACLPDVLHEAGYYQIFMGGAPSDFSGKQMFLAAHHYNEVWGWENWSNDPKYSAHRNAWGLEDGDLVHEAIERLPALRAHAPFHLSLLTIDTHPPGYPDPDCHAYAPGRPLLNAISCTDRAVGTLLDTLEAQGYLHDTVVVLMGDHTTFPSPSDEAALAPARTDWFGKVFLAAYWPGGPRNERLTVAGYTPDIAPTILDALGFRPIPSFAFGRSLLGPASDRTLLARHFEIHGGQMFPTHPAIGGPCDIAALRSARLPAANSVLSACEREKIIDSIEDKVEALK